MISRPNLADMICFAEAVWRLSGSDWHSGQLALAHAIQNCMWDRAAGSTARVAWALLPQIQRELIAGGEAGEVADGRPSFQDAAYCHAFSNVCIVVAGETEDPTHGATRFHRHDILPSWARRAEPLALIGSWFFYLN